ncbi:hypothetical protein PUN28_018160 [Cardiocondyla obscurior]|uniref:Uncharacterized protein n=1 Tax=Cardiocondyla obscurior TaxID=286306 RepID=A0AAW2EH44_9HYME
MEPYTEKGDALLPRRYAIELVTRAWQSPSIRTKCGNTRTERLTADYTPCTRVTRLPIRLIAPSNRVSTLVEGTTRGPSHCRRSRTAIIVRLIFLFFFFFFCFTCLVVDRSMARRYSRAIRQACCHIRDPA